MTSRRKEPDGKERKPVPARAAAGSETGAGTSRSGPRFAILLATYNGAHYLPEQLASLARQTVGHIDIWVSDDGSTDETLKMIDDWRDRWTKGTVTVVEGPRRGFAENFRSLLCHPDVKADFVAFCDQDDIWDDDKLEVAGRALEARPADEPALYCGRTRLLQDNGTISGLSPVMPAVPAFRNALVQSIAGANTMVLNASAHRLLRQASRDRPFVSHDWWSYLVVSGAGGHVHYDPQPHISYRQHAQNLVGGNSSLRAQFKRVAGLLNNRFRNWQDVNIEALRQNADLLTADNAALLTRFAEARATGNGFRIAGTIRKLRLQRQQRLSQMLLLLTALFGKV